jgi:hypothetical protein
MKHILLFGLPFNTQNLVTLQRWGVAVFAEIVPAGSLPLTPARRLNIANGTVPINDVLAYDIPGKQTESLNFQDIYQLNGSGTRDFYFGCAGLTDAWWSRISDRLVNQPITGMRYARLLHQSGRNYALTVDHNMPGILGPHVGEILRPRQVLQIVGLRPYGET